MKNWQSENSSKFSFDCASRALEARSSDRNRLTPRIPEPAVSVTCPPHALLYNTPVVFWHRNRSWTNSCPEFQVTRTSLISGPEPSLHQQVKWRLLCPHSASPALSLHCRPTGPWTVPGGALGALVLPNCCSKNPLEPVPLGQQTFLAEVPQMGRWVPGAGR